jgi:hypothetical protein
MTDFGPNRPSRCSHRTSDLARFFNQHVLDQEYLGEHIVVALRSCEALMSYQTSSKRIIGSLIFGIACASVGTAPANSANRPGPSARVVLPTAITPENYRIDIIPDAASLTFKASVEIDITVHQASNRIVLNSADIVIDGAVLSDEATALRISYDEKWQTATFALNHVIKPGAYTLRLGYHGKIYEQASGLFVLKYNTPKGTARAIHQVRKLRCPPLCPLVGRAGPQGDFRAYRHRASRPNGAIQYADRSDGRPARRTEASAFRGDPQDVVLSTFLRRRRLRARKSM